MLGAYFFCFLHKYYIGLKQFGRHKAYFDGDKMFLWRWFLMVANEERRGLKKCHEDKL